MKTSFKYSETYYNVESPKQIAPIILDYFTVDSVLDVGCGIGTWLKVFQDLEVSEVYGIDGSHITEEQLLVSKKYFESKDISKAFKLNRKFDLVLSLEVAEHLPEESADVYVNNLVQHGDLIIFSAAIPGQGGHNHVNEKWPSYWQNFFLKQGYYFYDILRPIIWENKGINFWYRQNIFIVAKRNHPALENQKPMKNILSIIHPELFEYYYKHASRATLMENGELGFSLAFNILLRTIKKYLNKRR